MASLPVSVVFEKEKKRELDQTDEKCHELEYIDRPERRLKRSLLAQHKQLEGNKDAYHNVGDDLSRLDSPNTPLLWGSHYSAKLNSINCF